MSHKNSQAPGTGESPGLSAGPSARNAGRSRPRMNWRGLAAVLALAATGLVAGAAVLVPASPRSTNLALAPTHRVERGELLVTVTEQGTLESSQNREIKCKVRGDNTIIWVVENGARVEPGDVLVRLDTLLIEEEISERTKFAHLARSAVARSKADVARAELAVREYEQGRFVAELATLKKDLAVLRSDLRSGQNLLAHARRMAENQYVSELEVEEKQFAVTRAELAVEVKLTEIEVLERFTKAEQLATLQGDLRAATAKYEADKETARADQQRLERAQDELTHCVVTAEQRGIVLYPTAKEWEEAPKIEEGATVHKDQVLLRMPDLTRMQVKVGIHESLVERIAVGLESRVALPDKLLSGKVASVASVAKPAGWWTGNVVKYDTIIDLPSVEGLKPGMTAEVEVVLARHPDVLLVPAAAVLQTAQGVACWVKTANGAQRRALVLIDYSDMFVAVGKGVARGEEVIINPLAFVEEAQDEAARTLGDTQPSPRISAF